MKTIWYRLMDVVDADSIDRAEAAIAQNDDMLEIRRLRMRWVGHNLHAEAHISVYPDLRTSQSHQIAEQVRHTMFHEFKELVDVTVHVDLWTGDIETVHELTIGYEPIPSLIIKD